ncbi:MAG TPA: 4'-phosphopantetheinyl transferase superfamily protein [Puia sp.]|nr:4'-phosphopantetheinyl transferase superfamily protein [Puia sp.]
MSILLYTTEYLHPIASGEFKSLVDQLPRDMRLKAVRFYRWQDSYGYVFGKLLLKVALKELGFSFELDQLQYSAHNKPFFSGGPHFNITHSGNRAICAVSQDRAIGVDIEYIDDTISIGDFQTELTAAEWEAICSAAAPNEQFFRFWTAKESLIKADGRGLSISLQEVDVSKGRIVLLGDKCWDLKSLDGFIGYTGHIAVEHLTPGSVMNSAAADEIELQVFSCSDLVLQTTI